MEGRAPISAAQFIAASARRSDLYESIRGLLADVDVIALPTAQLFPFDAELTWPREVAGRTMDTYHRWMEVSILATLINAPAIALPAGLGAAGLPIGVQLIGRNHDERGLLSAARTWQDVQPAVPLPALLEYLGD
ncbi:amidase family protein [Naasia lichenicola]|uniref:amidase family protein n=1 Tax=Naasia lichenicola TaxID=2565933 RepID=UPI0018EE5BFB|nr:amidase family protein [Naasia lichenicola]